MLVDAGSLVLPVDDLIQLAADVEEERVSLSVVPRHYRVIAGADRLIPRLSFLLDGRQCLKQSIDVGIQPSRLLSMAIDQEAKK